MNNIFGKHKKEEKINPEYIYKVPEGRPQLKAKRLTASVFTSQLLDKYNQQHQNTCRHVYHVTYNKSINKRGRHITLAPGKEIAFLNNFTKTFELKYHKAYSKNRSNN